MARVTFRIHYTTRWGENLLLERRSPASYDRAAGTERLPMRHEGNGYWNLSFDSCAPRERFEYRYLLQRGEGGCSCEPVFRELKLAASSSTVLDEWLPPELPEAAFSRQAFAGTVFCPDTQGVGTLEASGWRSLRLTLRAPRVMKGFRVCVSGGRSSLGNWDPAHARVMSGRHYPLWEVEIPISEPVLPIEFKFGLWSDREARLVRFEAGSNRRIWELPSEGESVVLNCAYFRHDNLWKGTGVSIPVSSLRSERGYGIGEFADLEAFARWAAGCGMNLVQILPVNDTTSDLSWRDSDPYKAISAMALHPIYINVPSLYEEYGLPLPEDYSSRREELNGLRQVDYEAVLRDKLGYLMQVYATVANRGIESWGFQEFFEGNGHWLKPYAAFCRLRDLYSSVDFARWGHYAVYGESKILPWFKPHAPEYVEVMFHCFVQFHLDRQLRKAVGAGRALGVAFKGDLPFGIERCSVEAWTEPELFRMDRQTGVPPDSLAVLDQHWGFLTYDWRKMGEDGYTWWRRRLERMSACFDALRIDHILGFFRIWEIPARYKEGIMGHYNPALPLSRAEIRAYGFHPDPARFAVPAVDERSLPIFFGDHAGKVARHLLYRDSDGYFRVKPEFNPPESREAWYAAGCSAEEAERIREGMERLGFEVLFLEDPDHPAHFHPRISLQNTALFASFEPPERDALSRLHDDFFCRRHDRFWEEEAMKKLPALTDATRMLICGEDLGVISATVPGVLKRLGILSLEVQRMPKALHGLFGLPESYPYMSVCTTSTHDMSTLRGWWEEDAESRQKFYNQVMGCEGEAPSECPPAVCEFVVRQHLSGASMWCILPLQDWLSLDPQLRDAVAAEERINMPSIPRHYWRYRMRVTLQELLQAAEFNQRVSRMIADSGRRPDY